MLGSADCSHGMLAVGAAGPSAKPTLPAATAMWLLLMLLGWLLRWPLPDALVRGAALPAALLVIFLALFALDKLMLLVVFLTPFAINLQNLDGGLGLSLPTEPIIFGIMMIFILKQLYAPGFDRRVLIAFHITPELVVIDRILYGGRDLAKALTEPS